MAALGPLDDWRNMDFPSPLSQGSDIIAAGVSVAASRPLDASTDRSRIAGQIFAGHEAPLEQLWQEDVAMTYSAERGKLKKL